MTILDGRPSALEADVRLGELLGARSDIDLVRVAELGREMTLRTGTADVVCGLRDCQEAVEEDPRRNFHGKAPADRAELLATRDAAVRLLNIIELAEAVA